MKKIIFVLLLSFGFGCSMLSESFKNELDRKMELEVLVNKVNQTLAWQTFDELVPLIEGNPHELMRMLTKEYKTTKINEVEVDQVTFEEESFRAYSVFKISAFSSPTYVLESHFDQIEWVYKAEEGGWKIKNLVIGRKSDKN